MIMKKLTSSSDLTVIIGQSFAGKSHLCSLFANVIDMDFHSSWVQNEFLWPDLNLFKGCVIVGQSHNMWERIKAFNGTFSVFNLVPHYSDYVSNLISRGTKKEWKGWLSHVTPKEFTKSRYYSLIKEYAPKAHMLSLPREGTAFSKQVTIPREIVPFCFFEAPDLAEVEPVRSPRPLVRSASILDLSLEEADFRTVLADIINNIEKRDAVFVMPSGGYLSNLISVLDFKWPSETFVFPSHVVSASAHLAVSLHKTDCVITFPETIGMHAWQGDHGDIRFYAPFQFASRRIINVPFEAYMTAVTGVSRNVVNVDVWSLSRAISDDVSAEFDARLLKSLV